MMMKEGQLEDASNSAKTAFWLAFLAIFLGYVAYAVLTVLALEKPDLLNSKLAFYLPRILLPTFSWTDVAYNVA